MLDTLISSKTRVKLLLKFFLNSGNSSYLRELESEFGESTNAIRLELNRLETAGLLRSSVEGNKKFFKANTEHPMFMDINSILLKVTGLDKLVEKVAGVLEGIDKLYLVGKLAKGLDSEIVDLIFIGNIDKDYLFKLVSKVEEKLNKKVKYTYYSPAEFGPEVLEADYIDHLLLWSK